ncbi:MAG: tRNA dihydrouridine synthase DusB [Clostridia bacterium]|nr:tRNA dihydrouridine synthase DusB [Clostridia bacterium]
MSLEIGGLKFARGVFAAPMASVSDRSFRRLCAEHGAELTYTEMISAKAIHYHDKKTDTLADISSDIRPVCIQLFGHEPDIMAEAVRHISEKFSPDIIDINMGCPVRKIVTSGDGSALMKDVRLIERLVSSAVDSTDIPVTVKMRTGWDDRSKNCVEAAKAAESAGAAAVCVHGRTKEQMYSSSVDLEMIAAVKNELSVPVIGNGGIMTARGAVDMFEKTGCDAVMIARGAQGDPWIFEEAIALLKGNDYERPCHDTVIKTACLHLDMMCADKGETAAVREARGQIPHYVKGFHGAAFVRGKLTTAESADEMKNILKSLR